MSGRLTKFRINKLHGNRTFDIDIEDNKLVLVGENGTGKSTVSNFIYYFLTRQWSRMINYNFDSISAVLDGEEIEITRDEILNKKDFGNLERDIRHFIPPSSRRMFSIALSEISVDDIYENPDLLFRLALRYDVPRRYIEEFLSHNPREVTLFDQRIIRVSDIIKNQMTAQVLYLPTYRRIEQDLASIFPEIALEIRRDLERLSRRAGTGNFIELVEFGMQDVANTITKKMDALKDTLRNDLNSLTGTYLRDVIRGAYHHVDSTLIINLDEKVIDTIFSRIDKRLLPIEEQKQLRGIIATIKQTGQLNEGDKVVAHFLTKLIELNKAQQESEKEINDFVEVCNGYLTGKEIVYDNLAFTITIPQNAILPKSDNDKKEKDLSLQALSSGEKQIVSLFSHIYLSGRDQYFVIIDEPELSLSVPWQNRFLPDILKTGRCNGVIAVTHSPYIFDNELESHTRSIEQFMEIES